MKKWSSNSSVLLHDLEPQNPPSAQDIAIQSEKTVKILGVHWTPATDTFQISVKRIDLAKPTKRNVLSIIAKFYDPLGWITPVTISFKIFMQTLWSRSIGWDDQLPPDVGSVWSSLYEGIEELSNVSISRWTGQDTDILRQELHGFADASSSAYAAAVYLKIISLTGHSRVTLLLAKSKVAPLKTISIPRLELCAAVLLSNLLNYLRETKNYPDCPTYCWTDSTITLGWILKPPATWTTFVANRVSAIQSNTANSIWRHVPSEQNPADCASRGVSAASFAQHPLWWSGPSWLQDSEPCWPDQQAVQNISTNLEMKKSVLA